MKGVEVKRLDIKRDERGWLVEVLRSEALKRGDRFGQFLITTAYPGYIKGNHYHTRKFEWYCVIRGEGKLVLEDNASGEREEMALSEEGITLVMIPPGITHAIENTGKDILSVLIYIDEPFNESDPDTFFKKIT
ncbi:MAG: cupin domain-containing protein [Proteobacteria bacterium]|nr:cupin domain-containing protein [Pseudomonadota bacterium]